MLFLFALFLALCQASLGLKCDQYDYVDPIIGSSGKGFGFVLSFTPSFLTIFACSFFPFSFLLR